jgi:hypothetical protein
MILRIMREGSNMILRRMRDRKQYDTEENEGKQYDTEDNEGGKQ